MIPKIIHYCWFGRNPKPKDTIKYINGWKKAFPDYEIKEWNEDNFDIENSIPYVKQAYEAKKYAFVSDYVRIYALYNYGGIYFDTDLEVIKSPDMLFEQYKMVLGFQEDNDLLTAFIATEKLNPALRKFMDFYENRKFYLDDGTMDTSAINYHFNKLMVSEGAVLNGRKQSKSNDFVIFPVEYFCAFDVRNWMINQTENTYLIHHMGCSWCDKKTKLKNKFYKLMQKILGNKLYKKLKSANKKSNG